MDFGCFQKKRIRLLPFSFLKQTECSRVSKKTQYYKHKANNCRREKAVTNSKTQDRKQQTYMTNTDTHTLTHTHHTKSFKLTCHFIQRCHNEGDGLFLWQFFLHLPNLLLPGITWNHKECWNNNNSSIQGSLSIHLVTLASGAKWMMYQLTPVEGGEM